MGELVMPPTYRILHLTDFHFDPKKIEDQKIIVSELKNDLARIGSEKSVDLIIFSGDLVNKGSDSESFEGAKVVLLDSIKASLSLFFLSKLPSGSAMMMGLFKRMNCSPDWLCFSRSVAFKKVRDRCCRISLELGFLSGDRTKYNFDIGRFNRFF
jgi:Calcineurin-like phosphoesterase